MKKTVLHIVSTNKYSGLESVAIDIIKNTQSPYQGIYVTQSGPIISYLDRHKIPYEIMSKLNRSELKRITLKYSPCIIHAHDYKASCIASLSRLNVSIISHLHNNSPWLKKFCPYSILYLFCSKKFDKILIVSKSILDEYIFKKRIRHKTICIKNPVDKNKASKMLPKSADKTKSYDICCVARITQQKNPDRFINIVAKIKKYNPTIKAVWIGEGELYDHMKAQIESASLSNNITLTGFQKNPYTYMNQSKLFLLTSDWEGFGLAAYEALSLGLPCITSNIGGLPMIVDNNCGKLCNNDGDFIKTSLSLLKDNRLYNEYSKNAILKAARLDNTSKYYASLMSIYRSISHDN